MDRDQDIMTSGFRHPFKAFYRAGCDKDGKLCALDVQLFSNGGYSMDLSLPVMDRALFHIDNCYEWPNLRVTGKICITNTPSNTAFRGFGGLFACYFCSSLCGASCRGSSHEALL
jgi:xanthine dehydrogenase molybdopterin-binding subunit B